MMALRLFILLEINLSPGVFHGSVALSLLLAFSMEDRGFCRSVSVAECNGRARAFNRNLVQKNI